MLAEIPAPLVASRWVHIAAAIAGIGSIWFFRVVLLPLGSAETTIPQMSRSVIRRFALTFHASVLALIVSGLYNSIVQLPQHSGQTEYLIVWIVKLVLSLVLFFLGAAVTGNHPLFEKLRRRRKGWLGLCLLLAGVILLLSNILRAMPLSSPAPLALH